MRNLLQVRKLEASLAAAEGQLQQSEAEVDGLRERSSLVKELLADLDKANQTGDTARQAMKDLKRERDQATVQMLAAVSKV